MTKAKSEAHLLMEKYLGELGLHVAPEYQFAAPERKWALDFYTHDSPRWRLGIEIDGGVYGTRDKFNRWQKGVQGRHNRPKGFEADLEKLNECAIRGISILRFTPAQVESGEAKSVIKRWLEAR